MKQPKNKTSLTLENEEVKSQNLIMNEVFLNKLEIQRRLLYIVVDDLVLQEQQAATNEQEFKSTINP